MQRQHLTLSLKTKEALYNCFKLDANPERIIVSRMYQPLQ